jgi:hypothetical protein
VVLLLMPRIVHISDGAHLLFLVPEMFRAVDRQFVHKGTDLCRWSRSSQSTLQVAAQFEYQLVFAVNFRNEHTVLLFRPFEFPHTNIRIISSRASSTMDPVAFRPPRIPLRPPAGAATERGRRAPELAAGIGRRKRLAQLRPRACRRTAARRRPRLTRAISDAIRVSSPRRSCPRGRRNGLLGERAARSALCHPTGAPGIIVRRTCATGRRAPPAPRACRLRVGIPAKCPRADLSGGSRRLRDLTPPAGPALRR